MERAIAQFNAVQFPPIGDFSVISMSFDLIDCLQFLSNLPQLRGISMSCNHYIDCSGRGRKKTSSLWRWLLSWMKIEICLFCFTSRHATAQLKVVLMFTIAIWQRKRIAEMIAHQSERQSLLERKVFVRKSILTSNLVGVGRIGIMMGSIKYYQMTLVGGFRLLGLHRGVRSSWEIKETVEDNLKYFEVKSWNWLSTIQNQIFIKILMSFKIYFLIVNKFWPWHTKTNYYPTRFIYMGRILFNLFLLFFDDSTEASIIWLEFHHNKSESFRNLFPLSSQSRLKVIKTPPTVYCSSHSAAKHLIIISHWHEFRSF